MKRVHISWLLKLKSGGFSKSPRIKSILRRKLTSTKDLKLLGRRRVTGTLLIFIRQLPEGKGTTTLLLRWLMGLSLPRDCSSHTYKDLFGVTATTSIHFDWSLIFDNITYDLTSLADNFTLEEVKLAVYSFGGSKTPGLDGLTLAFIQQFWEFIQEDVFT